MPRTTAALWLAVFLVGLLVIVNIRTPEARAQALEGAVRIVPPISSVDLADGPFTVFVVLDDLQHYGVLRYDDDRDTVPDREVESVGLAAFEFDLGFDPALLAVDDVQPSLVGLERTGRDFQCLQPREELGVISFGCVSTGPAPPGPQGTLTLASLVLRPIGLGSTPLTIDVELAGPLGSDNVPVAVSGAVVRVGGKTGAATPPRPTGFGGAVTTETGAAPTSATSASTIDVATTSEARPTVGLAATTTPDGVSVVRDDPDQGDVTEAERDEAASSGGLMPWLAVGLGIGAFVTVGATALVMRRAR